MLTASEAAHPDLLHDLEWVDKWPIPEFPLTGDDLRKSGLTQGKQLGDVLRQLEQHWEASDYKLTKQALMASLPDIAQ